MSLIIGEHVTHAFGDLEVFRNVSFRLAEADRIGLVGPNGEGKTTLLRVIGGMLGPTRGDVHRRRRLTVGYLPQDPPAPRSATVYDAMLEAFAPVRTLEARLETLAEEMARGESADLVKRYGAVQGEFESLGGYDYHTRIEQVLGGLAFEPDVWQRPLSDLSGGQRTRAYLATLLAAGPDVLLLDEPTNHLDLERAEWLEFWLQSFRGAVVVVSHDRYFLDRVTTKTWEVAFGRVEMFPGSYSKYAKLREDRYAERMKEWQAQQDYIDKTRDYIARNASGQRAREARGRRRRLERFLRDEAIERPPRHENIHLSFPSSRRTGDIVLRAGGLAVGYDAQLLAADDLQIERGDRVAVVGANGTGKTALVRTLLGEIKPLDGSVRWGANVDIGYLSQTHGELDPDTSLLNAILSLGQGLTVERARGLLGSVLLGGDDVFKSVGALSGGERSRLVLARLVVQEANVLLLDEPTNHLDIASTEIMQEALESFEGAVIFVTHDRYLVEAVATHIWAIDRGGIRCILGGWEEYLAWRGGRLGRAEAAAGADKGTRKAAYAESRKQSNLVQRLKRRHSELESEVEAVEAELASLSDDIDVAGQAGDVTRVTKLGKRYDERREHLTALWEEWEKVGDQLE